MSDNLRKIFFLIGMWNFASLETAAEKTMQHLTVLKPHVREKHVERDTGITADLRKVANILKRDMPTFYTLIIKENMQIQMGRNYKNTNQKQKPLNLKQNISEKVTKLDLMKKTEEEYLQRYKIINQKAEQLEAKMVKLKTETSIKEENNLAKIDKLIKELTKKDSEIVKLKNENERLKVEVDDVFAEIEYMKENPNNDHSSEESETEEEDVECDGITSL